MSKRIMVAPHWRPQVRDIVRTLRDARAYEPAEAPLDPVSLVRGLALVAAGRSDDVAVLLSDDDRSRLIDAAARVGKPPRPFRVWWNTADDISRFVASTAATGEVHISFFEDQQVHSPAAPGATIAFVPYAFTAPTVRPATIGAARIWYPAEVDISDDVLQHSVGGRGPSLERASTRIWTLARDVIDGDPTLVDADATLWRELGDPKARGPYRAALWTLRNRVRFLLVERLAAAFPGRLELRGSDWARLGFDAEPTKFERRNRLAQYGRCRVSIDLGSKSTHSWLYPRTADILAAAGGLVQFDSGASAVGVPPGLRRRRTQTFGELVDAVDRVLSLPDVELASENMELQSAYGVLRIRAGALLARTVAEHLS